jgi:virginiamycin B lyase
MDGTALGTRRDSPMCATMFSRRWMLVPALLVTVSALLALGAAQASAANKPAITFVAPSPAEGATEETDSVTFKFTYNRKPKATRSLVCALSGPTASSGPCDAPTALRADGSQSGASFSGLANGAYTLTVSLTLTDGGTASATRHFTVAVPVAPGHLYWSNGSNTIGRADLNGQNANQSFIGGASHPTGVAVDADHVYWTNLSAIGRADLDGQNANQSFIDSGSSFGVAVDADHVYWTDPFNGPDGTIGRANLNGTDPNPDFIDGVNRPINVAVDAGHVYWANQNTDSIGRADLDGQHANPSFITGASHPIGVAVDASHVYWTNPPDRIGRADLDGQNANQSFITGADTVRGVAVDAQHVYWTNSTTPGTIGRADLDGQHVNQSFITGATAPQEVAVGSG